MAWWMCPPPRPIPARAAPPVSAHRAFPSFGYSIGVWMQCANSVCLHYSTTSAALGSRRKYAVSRNSVPAHRHNIEHSNAQHAVFQCNARLCNAPHADTAPRDTVLWDAFTGMLQHTTVQCTRLGKATLQHNSARRGSARRGSARRGNARSGNTRRRNASRGNT